MAPDRGGFTLVEVLVAMVLLAIVMLMGRGLVGSVLDGAHRTDEYRGELDREMNAHRWLTAAFASAGTGDAGRPGSFEGDSGAVSFTAWLETPGGWPEPGTIRLAVAGTALTVEGPSRSFTLMAGVHRLDFDYLADLGANTAWVRAWRSAVSAPYAVRVRIDRRPARPRVDTLLLRIGSRG